MCFCMLAVMVHTPTATDYQVQTSDLVQALQHATQQQHKHTWKFIQAMLVTI